MTTKPLGAVFIATQNNINTVAQTRHDARYQLILKIATLQNTEAFKAVYTQEELTK